MYTERLRLTLINNVETVGFLYPKLFPIQQSVLPLTGGAAAVPASGNGNVAPPPLEIKMTVAE